MNDVKLRLSLYVPGAQMQSREESLGNPNEVMDKTSMQVRSGTGKNVKEETIFIYTRKQRLVRQNINITLEAFLYMTGKEAPYFSTPSIWSRKSKKERLKEHLDRIAENFNAKSYSFEILDD